MSSRSSESLAKPYFDRYITRVRVAGEEVSRENAFAEEVLAFTKKAQSIFPEEALSAIHARAPSRVR